LITLGAGNVSNLGPRILEALGSRTGERKGKREGEKGEES
jgi:hypothetical protein